VIQDLADRRGGQPRLRQEAHGWALGDEIDEVLGGRARRSRSWGADPSIVQSPHDVEPALPAEIDVDEATSGECSSALRIPSAPVVALAHDPKPFAFEQPLRGRDEVGAVVDQEHSHRHA
jgi:hypothetical protein